MKRAYRSLISARMVAQKMRDSFKNYKGKYRGVIHQQIDSIVTTIAVQLDALSRAPQIVQHISIVQNRR
jgi:hypothetical protein